MYTRIITTLAVLGAAAVLIAGLRFQSAVRALPERHLPDDADALLRVPIGRVNLNGRFADALAALQQASGANVVVRWGKLDEDDPDDWVRLSLTDVTLATALDALIGQVRSSEDVAFEPQGGTIVISTPGDLRDELSVRFYDARDVIHPDQLAAARQALGQSWGWGSSEDRLDALVRILKESDEGTWSGGDINMGGLVEINGLLAVRQPWKSHEAFEELLARIRRGPTDAADAKSPPAPPSPPPAAGPVPPAPG